MATSKFAFTDIQTFSVALEMANGKSCADAIRYVLGDDYKAEKHTPEAYARKVSHKVHLMEYAKANKPIVKSKARITNETIASSYVATLASGQEFNLNDLMSANPSVTTYSKAAAIVNVLVEDRRIVRNGCRNGKTVYKVA